jgi:UDP-N-acetylmuramoyl-tripeptide--D-alanyl-D-alanine ligase
LWRADTPGLASSIRPTGVIEVADTLRALQDLAHAVRLAAETRVIAITGSAGKTTTKETIAEMLGTRYRVVKNKGNLNNHIGLPLSLMQLRVRPDVAVMELGMNHAGEISRLVEIAEPGRSRVDERRRRAPRLLCVSRCLSRTPRARFCSGRQPPHCSSATPMTRV